MPGMHHKLEPHSPYPESHGLCSSNFLSGQSHPEASIPGLHEGSQGQGTLGPFLPLLLVRMEA